MRNEEEFIDTLMRMMQGEKNVLANKEKEGQKEIIRGAKLPRNMTPEKEVWEDLGFTFKDDDDYLFYQATLPDGWNVQGTENPMWCELIDKDGNVRGTIFYKAAFYDKKASMCLYQKYRISENCEWKDNSVVYEYSFGNDDEVLYTTNQIEIYDEEVNNDYELIEKILTSEKQKAIDYADENYPGWDSVKTYWNKEKVKEKTL